jgi:hypothetical protein
VEADLKNSHLCIVFHYVTGSIFSTLGKKKDDENGVTSHTNHIKGFLLYTKIDALYAKRLLIKILFTV